MEANGLNPNSFVDVGGLANGTTYYFRVRATNAEGSLKGPWSAVSNGAFPYTVPDAPTNVRLSNRVGNVVRVSWSVPSDNGYPITDYDVEVYDYSTATWSMFEGGTTTANYVEVTGLRNSQQYGFRVYAENAAGQSGVSVRGYPIWTSNTAWTYIYALDAPSAPTNVAVQSATANTIRVTFTTPAFDGDTLSAGDNFGATIYDYNVEYSTDPNFAAGTGTLYTGGASSTSTTILIPNLDGHKEYYVRVYASNDKVGACCWSARSNGAVAPTVAPGVQSNVVAARLSSQTVRLSFDRPADVGDSPLWDFDVE